MIQSLNPDQIAAITSGEIVGPGVTTAIRRIAIDSRQVIDSAHTLFVALKGAKVDGARFIPDLIAQGVSVFLISKTEKSNFPGITLICVEDTKVALQKLAEYQRSFFPNPLIAVTGSNGKTIVKEWLGQVLSERFLVAKSPKSYNSQVGVPLSVFGMEGFHQVAVMEAGVSQKGDMKALAGILQPDLGIFTNIGAAHDEGFADRNEKIKEKLTLFQKVKLLIYCSDHPEINEVIRQKIDPEKLISWSDRPGADYTRSVKILEQGARIILMKSDLSTHTFFTQFSDKASLENVTHVIIAALTLQLNPEQIQQGLQHLKPVDMRLTLKAGINDCSLIDDTYNNDLEGLRIALDFMKMQRPKSRKILIISDLLQQGSPDHWCPEVVNLIQNHGIDWVLGVGKSIRAIGDQWKGKIDFFETTQEMLDGLKPEFFQNDLILVTGARAFGFESVINLLQQRIHGTVLEINLNALTHNFNFIKKRLHPDTKVMVMVKAFAYGGGAVEISNHLQTLGADYLAVAYTDEGVTLRQHGIKLPIMVMNPLEESFHLLRQFDLEPVVFSLEFFKKLNRWCFEQDAALKIHLDLDTGMHRLGFEAGDLAELRIELQHTKNLKIASIYTHLVGSDEQIHEEYSREQLENFQHMKDSILEVLDEKPLIHALNSGGIIRFPEYQWDMVRLGIGLYGIEVTGNHDSALKSVSTLKTTVSQVKSLAPGETVGYSRKGMMEKGGKIATLPIGYADGFDRRFSNGKGYVLIHGKKAPVIGNVCMDMVMVDVTGMAVRTGDEAVVYGQEISLKELSERIGTIPYELLTNISSRVKRVYYLD
ncbi:UDP-N-acetylmuramoyl-tripeptide--D-alanyl-D-alanine ligase [Algoriphagus hitonicola]|uniref:Alanine racemase n=2 Tax=Algoriphagus hitonicola TaxID=435880 RepID=A0A1I2QB15_9BACT|nr:bifunctional UDP-N-acetylmuramoyl-tripeptide:D-alanyl-D-alanine ligase/alanine racemase [Algoriphagus hitonicola]SFG25498.1 UDP-N-acetylmuramoyl-tripeptide--D-alanyl-D-alanine ligase [Algoriphagus hitonicola]